MIPPQDCITIWEMKSNVKPARGVARDDATATPGIMMSDDRSIPKVSRSSTLPNIAPFSTASNSSNTPVPPMLPLSQHQSCPRNIYWSRPWSLLKQADAGFRTKLSSLIKGLENKPERGSWTNVHCSPRRVSGKSKGRACSCSESGVAPSWKPGCRR